MPVAHDAPTLASEALRRGTVGLGRSFRFHRPRGALCGRGYCAQCEIETPAGPMLGCEAPPDAASRRFDVLRGAGRIAERWPPWFYERRFLRPAAGRRLYLHALRHLSAAPRLAAAPGFAGARSFREEETDVARVGPGGNIGGLPLGVYPERVLGVLRADALVALRFERLVLTLEMYDRLPPIAGNDLPGLVGLPAFRRYAAAGGVRRGVRVGVWGPEAARERARAIAREHGAEIVWEDERAPGRLVGRGKLRALDAGARIPCDLFVVAVAQPALELALQAGATAELTTAQLPVLRVAETPSWLTVEGGAADGSGVPDVEADDHAFACLCEDVRVGDVRRAIADGFDHPELVKRRTGALTGPCQGKLCTPLVLALLREAGRPHAPTTPRPLAWPVPLAELAADA